MLGGGSGSVTGCFCSAESSLPFPTPTLTDIDRHHKDGAKDGHHDGNDQKGSHPGLETWRDRLEWTPLVGAPTGRCSHWRVLPALAQSSCILQNVGLLLSQLSSSSIVGNVVVRDILNCFVVFAHLYNLGDSTLGGSRGGG